MFTRAGLRAAYAFRFRQTDMDSLPDELIGHLLGFLDSDSRNAFSQVSKRVREQDKETRECLLKTRIPFELQNALRAFPKAYGAEFMVTCGNIVTLEAGVVRGMKFSSLTHIDMARVVIRDSLFRSLMLGRGPMMEFLRLRRCSVNNAALCVRDYCKPDLLTLCDLSGTSKAADAIWVSTKLKGKHLKAFDPKTPKEFPFARVIKMDKPGLILREELELLIRKCPNLEQASLGGRLRHNPTVLFLGALVSSPKLKTLHLSSYAMNDDILKILLKMKHLESLHLDFKVFSADIIAFLANFRNLKSVGLAKTTTMLDVSKLSNTVESLHLSKTTKTAAIQAIGGMPNLHTFEIGGSDLGDSLFESFDKGELKRMRSVCLMGDCASAKDLVYRTASLKHFEMKRVFIDNVWDIAFGAPEVNALMDHSGHTLQETHLVVTPEGLSALSAQAPKREDLKIIALAVAVPDNYEIAALKAAAVASIFEESSLMMTQTINLLDLYFLVKDAFMADELLRLFKGVAGSSMVSDLHCFISSGDEDDVCKFVRVELSRCGAR